MSERLQKVLAKAGLGSRRAMETHIENGNVLVNGKVATLGQQVDERDRLTFKGKKVKNPLSQTKRVRVVIYHKPVGQICTNACPEGRKTVFDAVKKFQHGHWIMVGRLDINTSGLLLFTNCGELANRLMHPKYEIEREYAVRVLGEVSQETLTNLSKGVTLDDGPAKFDAIKDAGGQGANHWYHVMLKEGRNREVRRLWESQGTEVSRLIRIRYANITMPKFVSRGKDYELSNDEVRQLCQKVGLKDTF